MYFSSSCRSQFSSKTRFLVVNNSSDIAVIAQPVGRSKRITSRSLIEEVISGSLMRPLLFARFANYTNTRTV